jgi:hypothetical protein
LIFKIIFEIYLFYTFQRWVFESKQRKVVDAQVLN